ncbi:hypothetical protein FD29_GL001996 [Companilactobacillus mindensis DSM 14500]|uniref:ABC transporter permease n=1 Tax=Companilactobacillus mindensis DSM 14500 TaxID=1423770 RepID=A0A0R1QJ33_9LACO|nr:ABC transporter permease [Companilactobacillus mindensis]KRL44799.1 hypothetical protein FD29_GL001996 [Companilactobacillus mindensis DSM 14500]GEO78022.1 ABC transporter permease [Companilactobacillus mindensis]
MKRNVKSIRVALQVELQKTFKSKLVLMVSLAFLFLLLIRRGQNWQTFTENALFLYTSLIGMVGFGVVSSWVFAHEYQDGVFKDLLALPISRMEIIIAKLLVIEIAGVIIAGICTIIMLIFGITLFHTTIPGDIVVESIRKILVITALDLPLALLWPLLASLWKSAILPMSLSFITVIISVVFSSESIGRFIPWAIPGYYLANNGNLPYLSTVILSLIGIVGIIGTAYIWIRRDQK